MAKSRVTDTLDDDEVDEPATRARTSGSSRAKNGAARRKRGRSMVAIALVVFVLVASAVIWRRSYGITQSRELSDLTKRKYQLLGDLARLQAAIRDESSRNQLDPAVRALGMRVPQDQQVRILPK